MARQFKSKNKLFKREISCLVCWSAFAPSKQLTAINCCPMKRTLLMSISGEPLIVCTACAHPRFISIRRVPTTEYGGKAEKMKKLFVTWHLVWNLDKYYCFFLKRKKENESGNAENMTLRIISTSFFFVRFRFNQWCGPTQPPPLLPCLITFISFVAVLWGGKSWSFSQKNSQHWEMTKRISWHEAVFKSLAFFFSST